MLLDTIRQHSIIINQYKTTRIPSSSYIGIVWLLMISRPEPATWLHSTGVIFTSCTKTSRTEPEKIVMNKIQDVESGAY